jgi:hypothetical protein
MDDVQHKRCQVKPAPGDEIIETPTALVWVDEEGIAYFLPKKVKRTKENVTQGVKALTDRFGESKVCMICDITHPPIYSREMRGLLARELPKMIKAMGVLACSPAGKMTANLLYLAWRPPYPVKIFTSEEQAKQWIRQYL